MLQETKVHVALLGEGTSVWCPVPTRQIAASVFELLGLMPPGEEWQFKPGELVECLEQTFAGGESGLVAHRVLPPDNS